MKSTMMQVPLNIYHVLERAGKLFGAHGGVLDRLDAVMFTVPVAYYAAVALGYS